MIKSITCLAALGLAAMLFAGHTAAQDRPAARAAKPAAAKEKGRPADEEAIRKQAQDFMQAFEKGEAKAIGDFWTENGEYYDDEGVELRGRAAIEKAYAAMFKEKHPGRLQIEILSIRFPSRDTAVEEGVLRLTRPGAELPTSTRYSVLHAREDGTWKSAISREWGAGVDKLDDLAWLIGDWSASSKEHAVRVSFKWNEKKSAIVKHFSLKEAGKEISSGTQTINLDPQTGQIRSWLFDDEGGRGESLWFRDGNRWVQDSIGVLPDGSETSAVNVITRIDDDAFTWRSVDRMVGESPVPDTDPVKLTRVVPEK